MTYKVTLNSKMTTKLNNLIKGNDAAQQLSAFMSYIGTARSKTATKTSVQHHIKFVLGMINTFPELASVKSYQTLLQERPELFIEGEMTLHKQKTTVEAIEATPIAQAPIAPTQEDTRTFVPGVDTPITAAALDVDVITDKPFDLQVALKYTQLYNSATRRGLDWNLTLVDIAKILERKTCYYTGARMKGTGVNRRTVDRIDSNKGYVKGNIVACTHTANQLKSFLFENDRSELKTTKKMLEKMLAKLPD